MVRQKRSRSLYGKSDELLVHELRAHLKRALSTLQELDAVLGVQGATWEMTGVVAREAAGHLGRIVAICRVGAMRKLLTQPETATHTNIPFEAAVEGAV